jgi:hypothetical protein
MGLYLTTRLCPAMEPASEWKDKLQNGGKYFKL